MPEPEYDHTLELGEERVTTHPTPDREGCDFDAYVDRDWSGDDLEPGRYLFTFHRAAGRLLERHLLRHGGRTVMTDDLIAFLRARFDEREHYAIHTHLGPCAANNGDLPYLPDRCDCGGPSMVRREVATLRRTVDLCAAPLIVVRTIDRNPDDPPETIPGEGPPWALPVLTELAKHWPAHPDHPHRTGDAR